MRHGNPRRAKHPVHRRCCLPDPPCSGCFCFAKEDLVDVQLSKSKFSTLIAPLPNVRQRLLERDKLAREVFPDSADLWSGWRTVIDSVDRAYLKLDPYELWMLCKDEKKVGRPN